MIDLTNAPFCVSLVVFTDKGLEIQGSSGTSTIDESEMNRIVNYYSVILGIAESQSGLYGPVPVAYKLETLLFIYTFEIKNFNIKDQRVIDNKNIVPASLFVFFPTSIDGIAARCRKDINTIISSWKDNFKDINEISIEDLKFIKKQIKERIAQEVQLTSKDTHNNAIIVASKNFQLLDTVAHNRKQNKKLVLAGTTDLLFTVAKQAFLANNYERILEYKVVETAPEYIEIKTRNLDISLIDIRANYGRIRKTISKDLDGVLFFADFSNPEKAKKNTEELKNLISSTTDRCTICFVLSNTTKPVDINQTDLPSVLKCAATGRTISLLDLSRPNTTLELTIIEFIDRVISSIKEK